MDRFSPGSEAQVQKYRDQEPFTDSHPCMPIFAFNARNCRCVHGSPLLHSGSKPLSDARIKNRVSMTC